MSVVYHNTPNPTTKVCSRCHIEKPLDLFFKQSKAKDGLRPHCKDCAAIAQKKYFETHPRKKRDYSAFPPDVHSRVCTCCHIEKPLDAFSKCRKNRLGVRAHCKACISEQDKLKRKQIADARPMPEPSTSRVCKVCHIKKPLEDFYKVGGTEFPNAYRGECKACTLEEQRTRHFQKKIRKLQQQPLFIFSRVCTKCAQEKPIEEFGTNKLLPHGVHSRCKACMSEEVRQRALRIAECVIPLTKQCGRCGIEKQLEQFPVSTGYGKYGRSSVCSECASRRFQENKDKYSATNALWRKNNPLKDRNRAQRYQARKKNATQIDNIDYARILERDGLWCYLCKQDILPHHKMHFDHIIPLVKGGAHTEENLKPTHAQCNCRKQDRLLSELTEYDLRGPDA